MVRPTEYGREHDCGNNASVNRSALGLTRSMVDDDRSATRDIPPCGCITPGAVSAATCYCAVEDLLRIIRRRYSLAVMNAIHTRGMARYHDIASSVPKASSSTLAETLQALEHSQLVTRGPLSELQPSIVYALSPSGVKLLSRLRRLLDEVR